MKRRRPTKTPRATRTPGSLTLAEAAQAWSRHLAQQLKLRLAKHCKNLQRCDQCGAEAKIADEVCGVCGASSPVRVPRFVPAAIGAAALAILLLVWCCS